MPITAHENTTISDIIAALHGYKVLMAIKTKFIAPVGKFIFFVKASTYMNVCVGQQANLGANFCVSGWRFCCQEFAEKTDQVCQEIIMVSISHKTPMHLNVVFLFTR